MSRQHLPMVGDFPLWDDEEQMLREHYGRGMRGGPLRGGGGGGGRLRVGPRIRGGMMRRPAAIPRPLRPPRRPPMRGMMPGQGYSQDYSQGYEDVGGYRDPYALDGYSEEGGELDLTAEGAQLDAMLGGPAFGQAMFGFESDAVLAADDAFGGTGAPAKYGHPPGCGCPRCARPCRCPSSSYGTFEARPSDDRPPGSEWARPDSKERWGDDDVEPSHFSDSFKVGAGLAAGMLAVAAGFVLVGRALS